MIKKALALFVLGASVNAQSFEIDCNKDSTNGKVFQASNGKLYKISCDIDIDNHGLEERSDLSATQCVEACATTDSCVAVTYLETLKRCYLKNGVGSSWSELDATVAIQLENVYIPAFKEPDCVNDDTQKKVVIDRYGVTYYVFCDVSLNTTPMADYSSLTAEECITKCSTTPDCDIATYTGKCFLRTFANPEDKIEGKGYLTAKRYSACEDHFDSVTGGCLDACPDLRNESAGLNEGSVICSAKCYPGLYWDITNQKCVVECGDNQVASVTSDIKTCADKTTSLFAKNVMMIKKKN